MHSQPGEGNRSIGDGIIPEEKTRDTTNLKKGTACPRVIGRTQKSLKEIRRRTLCPLTLKDTKAPRKGIAPGREHQASENSL